MVFESLNNIVVATDESVCRNRRDHTTVKPVKQTPTTVKSQTTVETQSHNSSETKQQPPKPSKRRRRTRTNSTGVVDMRSKQSALWELCGAIFVYGMCVTLPMILGVIVRLYQNTFLSGGGETQNRTSWASAPIIEPPKTAWYKRSSSSSSSSASSSYQEEETMSFSSVFLTVLQRWAAAYLQTNALSDVQFVIMTSIALALFRVLLIHFLVPKNIVHTRVEALVRCKSTHLLSSTEYHFDTITNFNNGGIVASPRRFSQKLTIPQMLPEGFPLIPDMDIDNNDTTTRGPPTLKPKNKNRKRFREYLQSLYTTTRNSLRRTLGTTPTTPTTNLPPASQTPHRSAPRYATAIFRFTCATLSTTWAILHFHSANFWPVWVGGTTLTAQTKNCWDLSGSVAALHGQTSLDSDFDHQNESLRYFFLGQASYQMHSLCFHALSMVLLAFYGGAGGKRGYFHVWRTSMTSYLKPIIEHLLSITLIMSSFLFSGTRRLGAIAIFALEGSSLFLQLLQICINAPIGSRLRRPRTIKIAHRYLTIPIFVYSRFFVVPFVVLYSALFESRDWIRQIERAMAPGFGAMLYYFFNGLLLVVVGLNFISLRRLLYHPHVRQILS